ncbi:MAG TPA: hypothetical protein VF363_04430, partial [Candidatus Eisenbacteria bacterium]
MTAATLRMDEFACRRRTRWTMGVSAVLHALLFLWIATQKTSAIDLPKITEITLIEPGDLAAAAAAAAPAAARRSDPGFASRAVAQDMAFRRTDRADIAMDP